MEIVEPYIDHEVTDEYIIREFTENVDPRELMWHRDHEDRWVEVLHETNWQFQHDNSLPININEGFSIPKNEWHRLIKGTGSLKVKIYKKPE
jgi:hypothetical protein